MLDLLGDSYARLRLWLKKGLLGPALEENKRGHGPGRGRRFTLAHAVLARTLHDIFKIVPTSSLESFGKADLGKDLRESVTEFVRSPRGVGVGTDHRLLLWGWMRILWDAERGDWRVSKMRVGTDAFSDTRATVVVLINLRQIADEVQAFIEREGAVVR